VQKGAAQFREFSTQRGQREAQAGQRVQAPSQPGAVPRAVQVALPQARPAPVTIGAPARVPPARLVMPTLVPQQAVNPASARPPDRQPTPSPAAQPKPPPREQPPAKKGKGSTRKTLFE